MIREITDKNIWDNFVKSLKPNTFLQAWAWGETQVADGENVLRLGVYRDEQLVAAAQVIIVDARRGRHFLIPHGPLCTQQASYELVLAELVEYLRQASRKWKVVGLRVAPLVENNSDHLNMFKKMGFRSAPLHVHTELTWVLDISGTEEQVLANMRKTSRHAIRKAEQVGVRAEILSDEQSLDRFAPLYNETRKRHGFVPFSSNMIAAEVKSFAADNNIFIVIAHYDGRDVAAGIFVQFGPTVFYHHGASTKLASNIPAAHLVQWAAIREAKRRGATMFNFWGIAPDGQPDHPFAGITVFKKGFGGQAIDYLHAQDLPLSSGYSLLWLVDYWRKIRRGF